MMAASPSAQLPVQGPVLIQAGLVLGPNGPAEQAAVAVDGDRFVAVGQIDELRAAYPDFALVERLDLALVPGFVDCHNHVSQTFAKAIACGEPAQIWRRIWAPLRSAMSPEDVYLATKWAAAELLRGGFTTVVVAGEQFGERSAAALSALDESGIRTTFALGFSDHADAAMQSSSSTRPSSTTQCLQVAEKALNSGPYSSRVKLSLSCGTVHSASPTLIRELARLCDSAGVLFQMHANEHTAEVEYCINTYGRRPLELLAEQGALGPHTLLAHTTLVTPSEVTLLAQSRTAVSYNPVASAWKGNGVAPALEFAAQSVRFGLGTDATRNDGFRLLDAAETAQRLTRGMTIDDFSTGAGGLWVHAATAGGADAAGLGNVTGAIMPGKHADFLLLAMNTPECQPSWDFTWELVRYYDRTNLVASYVDGRLALKDGQPIAYDAQDLVRVNIERARSVIGEAPITLVHGPSRLTASRGPGSGTDHHTV